MLKHFKVLKLHCLLDYITGHTVTWSHPTIIGHMVIKKILYSETFLRIKKTTKRYRRVVYYSADICCSSPNLNSLLVAQIVYIDLKLFLK